VCGFVPGCRVLLVVVVVVAGTRWLVVVCGGGCCVGFGCFWFLVVCLGLWVCLRFFCVDVGFFVWGWGVWWFWGGFSPGPGFGGAGAGFLVLCLLLRCMGGFLGWCVFGLSLFDALRCSWRRVLYIAGCLCFSGSPCVVVWDWAGSGCGVGGDCGVVLGGWWRLSPLMGFGCCCALVMCVCALLVICGLCFVSVRAVRRCFWCAWVWGGFGPSGLVGWCVLFFAVWGVFFFVLYVVVLRGCWGGRCHMLGLVGFVWVHSCVFFCGRERDCFVVVLGGACGGVPSA